MKVFRGFDILRPDLSFTIAFITYLTLALIGGARPTALTYLAIALGLISYLIGVKLGGRLLEGGRLLNMVCGRMVLNGFFILISSYWLLEFIQMPLKYWWMNVVLIFICIAFLKITERADERVIRIESLTLLAMGSAVYLYLVISLGNLPIFMPRLKQEAYINILRVSSFIGFMVGGIGILILQDLRSLKGKALTSLIAITLATLYILLGYRSHVLVALLTFIAIGWHRGIIGWRSLTIAALTITPALIIASQLPQASLVKDIPFIRPASSIRYLDMVIRCSGPLGSTYGRCLLAVNPDARVIIHQVILQHYFPPEWRYPIGTVGLATTWLGPAYLDFGFLGIATLMTLLGALTSFGYNLLKRSRGLRVQGLLIEGSYCLLWSLILIGVDVGPDFIILGCLLIIAYSFIHVAARNYKGSYQAS